MQQPGDQMWNVGAPMSNGGGWAPLAPCWRRPCSWAHDLRTAQKRLRTASSLFADLLSSIGPLPGSIKPLNSRYVHVHTHVKAAKVNKMHNVWDFCVIFRQLVHHLRNLEARKIFLRTWQMFLQKKLGMFIKNLCLGKNTFFTLVWTRKTTSAIEHSQTRPAALVKYKNTTSTYCEEFPVQSIATNHR